MRISPLFLSLLALPALALPQAPANLLRDYHVRSLGPASAGGRIVDIRALDRDPSFALVAAASGGVWKTTDMGTTWSDIFAHYGSSSIGAVAIFQPNPKILWVGTGEPNNRNSVSWGDGIYKSSDGGATFQDVGLANTYQIARIVTHPANPDIVYVAAIGDLWGGRGERGVFKTSDGGRTWQHLTHGLPNDGTTGAIDLVMDPSNPEVLYAAMYQRLRRPWRFDSGGPHGGIFKTTDGGTHWTQLTAGLPGEPLGRIGLAISRNHPQTVMAFVEASFGWQCNGRGAAKIPACGNLDKLGSGIYRSDDGGAHWHFLNRYNHRPFYFSQIRIDPTNDQIVYTLTTAVRKSTDGGRTFVTEHAPFGPNYDYHAMWLDPQNGNFFYLGGDKGLFLTHNGGKSLRFIDNLPIEQFYKVATDDRIPYAIYGGLQDDGSYATMSFTRDVVGIRNDSTWKMHWDDGQYIAVDPNNWRIIYSEGTEGSFRVVDPIGHTDSSRRATPGNITNFKAATGIAPNAPHAAAAIRYNWTTPFIISPHDPKRIYYGTNYLLTSTDEGRHWTIISPDLSKHIPSENQIGTGGLTPDNTGAEGYATIYSISESPVVKGLIWVGTDDGNIWVTHDGGGHWTEVDANMPDVPKNLWVSRILASAANPQTAYVAFDGHRSDNYQTWLFKTTDGGQTWTDLSANLEANDPIYVIAEDDKNPALLFIGCHTGVQVSFDGGQHWQPLTWQANGLPTVTVRDIIIQPRQRDLILATHGHGIYVLDDISALEQWHAAMAQAPVTLFTQRPGRLWIDMSRDGQTGSNVWAGGNPPEVAPAQPDRRDRQHIHDTPVITFALGEGAHGTAALEITDPAGQTRTLSMPARPGITRYIWDGAMTAPRRSRGGFFRPPAALLPGVYQLQLSADGATARGLLQLLPDPLAAVQGRVH
ncbi:MAG: WD40/YVTN/BNR-like repeat-containing protein [Terriglobales bacterium]